MICAHCQKDKELQKFANRRDCVCHACHSKVKRGKKIPVESVPERLLALESENAALKTRIATLELEIKEKDALMFSLGKISPAPAVQFATAPPPVPKMTSELPVIDRAKNPVMRPN